MTYSIVTTARNEAIYIKHTLESVISQTVRPQEWVIMDDGSQDQTADIVEVFAKQYPWIKFIKLRNFKPEITSTGGRVGHLLNIAAKELKKPADFYVKLDADTRFGPDFFRLLLDEFKTNPKLGIASGQLYFEGKAHPMEPGETKGAVMVIRYEVFKKIGGFFESRGRGEDTLFSVAARFYGWETDNFPIRFDHLKPEGIRHSSLTQALTTGIYKGSIPYRLDFFLLTQAKHLFKPPYILGSLFQVAGYLKSRYLAPYRPFPPYVGQQLQAEQLRKMKGVVSKSGS